MKLMVSRRNFIVIATMMMVLLVLFQFSLVFKDQGNRYDQNEYIQKSDLAEENSWKITESDDTHALLGRDYVVYIGAKDREVYNTARQWCIYTKRNLITIRHPSDYLLNVFRPPVMILIDGENLDLDADLEYIEYWTRQEVSVAFCTLPDVEKVKEYPLLMKMMGVDEVLGDSVTINGVHVFSGFLLGGDSVYEVKNAADSGKMDLNLQVPWYHTFNGSKTYIMGMMDPEPEETDKQPPLLWRYGNSKSQVFAVCGDYIKDLSGMGYLEAMLADSRDYDFYPVVNAQSMSVVNFPSLTEENTAAINQIYSRKQRALYKELIWPNLIAVMEDSGFIPTCFLTPKFQYETTEQPSEEELIFYLKQFKEQKAETGLSETLHFGGSLNAKIQKDSEFFASVENDYVYSAVYESGDLLEELKAFLSEELFSGVRTIVADRDEKDPLFSYAKGTVTVQGITNNAFDFHYSDDLKLKGYETALGYSNVLLDLTDIAWPKEENDEWQNRSEIFSANVGTYWKPYAGFARTTASENDFRIRNFLSLDYKSRRADSLVYATVTGFEKEAWFVFRTHGEEIKSMVGGEFHKLENDVYLIRVGQEDILLELIRVSDHVFTE